jgi:hypothetical protein
MCGHPLGLEVVVLVVTRGSLLAVGCRPLANVLAEEFHAEFEENVRRMMNMQQRRPLAGDELVTRNKFVRKDGSKVWMEGKGQAWQRDDVVEFVMVYRERSQPPHTDAPSGTAAPGEPVRATRSLHFAAIS